MTLRARSSMCARSRRHSSCEWAPAGGTSERDIDVAMVSTASARDIAVLHAIRETTSMCLLYVGEVRAPNFCESDARFLGEPRPPVKFDNLR